MTPLKRFYNLLDLDKKDIVQIFFYAIFAGLVSLSLPLGIQAIINFIQAGRASASWVVLIILVVIIAEVFLFRWVIKIIIRLHEILLIMFII